MHDVHLHFTFLPALRASIMLINSLKAFLQEKAHIFNQISLKNSISYCFLSAHVLHAHIILLGTLGSNYKTNAIFIFFLFLFKNCGFQLRDQLSYFFKNIFAWCTGIKLFFSKLPGLDITSLWVTRDNQFTKATSCAKNIPITLLSGTFCVYTIL